MTTDNETLDAVGRTAVRRLVESVGVAPSAESVCAEIIGDAVKDAIERGVLPTPEQAEARVQNALLKANLCEAHQKHADYCLLCLHHHSKVAVAAALERVSQHVPAVHISLGIRSCSCGWKRTYGITEAQAQVEWQQHILSLAPTDTLSQVYDAHVATIKFIQERYPKWDGTADGSGISLTGCANLMREYVDRLCQQTTDEAGLVDALYEIPIIHENMTRLFIREQLMPLIRSYINIKCIALEMEIVSNRDKDWVLALAVAGTKDVPIAPEPNVIRSWLDKAQASVAAFKVQVVTRLRAVAKVYGEGGHTHREKMLNALATEFESNPTNDTAIETMLAQARLGEAKWWRAREQNPPKYSEGDSCSIAEAREEEATERIVMLTEKAAGNIKSLYGQMYNTYKVWYSKIYDDPEKAWCIQESYSIGEIKFAREFHVRGAAIRVSGFCNPNVPVKAFLLITANLEITNGVAIFE